MRSQELNSLPPYTKPRVITIALIIAGIAVAGLMLVLRYGAMDLNRDMKTWQDKLNLITESRSSAVTEWVNGHFVEMKKLGENPSLQLYLADLKELPSDENRSSVEPAQKSYLRNLLIFTADRLGFAPESIPLSVQLPAQVPFSAQSGLAVLNMDGEIIVSTPYLSSLESQVKEKIANSAPEKPLLIDMYRGDKGVVNMGFVVPVYGIQDDPSASSPIARIVGIKAVNENLFKLLRHPGITEKTLSALLVRKDGDNVTYLSPLSEGGGALDKSLAAQPDSLAEAYAIENPNAFGDGQDFANTRVLFTSRAIEGTPWTLMLKVDYAEAFSENAVRRSGMLTILTLAVGWVVLMVFAVWYSASSRRAMVSTRFFKEMAQASRAQEQLLRLVSDNQPQGIYILDNEGHYRFSNRTASVAAEMRDTDMIGKPITDVLGAGRAQEIIDTAQAVLYNQHSQTRVRRMNEGGDELIVRSEYIPLSHIPLPGLKENTSGVLVVEQDISDVVHERERRMRLHAEVIETLISIVDMRDPHAANHSMLVSQIAQEVAACMGLDAEWIETTRISGSLMNIGKIIIPAPVLTKKDLSDEEKRAFRDSLSIGAELLSHISFEGPVVETLQQVQERWDGSGPDGLREDGIIISARIIAVANAFVGMISPRAYRSAMAVDAALKELLDNVDVAYDRKVVVALANYIDNLGGRMLLEQMKAA